MNFLKNSEISREYGVSNTAVARWIERALSGKNDLQLVNYKDKDHILSNAHNIAIIRELSSHGKKYKTASNLLKASTNEDFYEIFTPNEISEIYNDLLFNSEIKFKYSYKNGGAEAWDEYYLSGVSQHVAVNEEFLKASYSDITSNISKSKKINIWDLGPGNGYPLKDLITFLKSSDFKINNYFCLDISNEIIHITLENISKWFPSITAKGFNADFDTSTLNSLFLGNSKEDEVNIILYLGHTFSNHKDRYTVLKNFRSGMSGEDLLIFSYTNDNELNHGGFSYVKNDNAEFRHTWVAKCLGFEIDKCEVLYEFDDVKQARFKYLLLDKDYKIELKIFGNIRTLEFLKGQKISIWQHYLVNTKELIDTFEEARLGFIAIKQDYTLCHGCAITKAK